MNATRYLAPTISLLLMLLWHTSLAAQDGTAKVFAPAEELRSRSEAADAALLAPRSYLSAVQTLERARADASNGVDAERINQRLDEASESFRAALATAQVAAIEFEAVIEARGDANSVEAFRLSSADWTRAEELFSDAVKALEKQDLEKARQRGNEASSAFRLAELNAIKARVLGEARSALMDTDKARAERQAPRTLAAARGLLLEAETAIELDRYSLDEATRLAGMAAQQARHAISIAAVGERLRSKEITLEDVILDWESPLSNLATLAGQPADFSAGYGAVENALRDELARIPNLEQDLAESQRQIVGLEEEMRELDEQLGGANAERSDLIRRMEAQARVREQFASVSALYTPEEAVVLRDGNNLILRMLGLSFPSGSTRLDAKAMALLDRLGEAANIFPRSQLIVEGHTDTSGSARTNLRLSRERAAAVADYLTTQLGIQSFRVRAKGFGDARPVANNMTAEGRARNRRIDVRILAQGE